MDLSEHEEDSIENGVNRIGRSDGASGGNAGTA